MHKALELRKIEASISSLVGELIKLGLESDIVYLSKYASGVDGTTRKERETLNSVINSFPKYKDYIEFLAEKLQVTGKSLNLLRYFHLAIYYALSEENLVAGEPSFDIIEKEFERVINENYVDALSSPIAALQWAIQIEGSDIIRIVASKDPYHAYSYANRIDEGPHDVTRIGASKNPNYAFTYARIIDKGPHEVTRAGALIEPLFAVRYAIEIEKKQAREAFKELIDVIANTPGVNPWLAFDYSEFTKIKNDQLREISCREPRLGYYYARDIDKGPHPVTWAAVKTVQERNSANGKTYQELYIERFPEVQNAPYFDFVQSQPESPLSNEQLFLSGGNDE